MNKKKIMRMFLSSLFIFIPIQSHASECLFENQNQMSFMVAEDVVAYLAGSSSFLSDKRVAMTEKPSDRSAALRDKLKLQSNQKLKDNIISYIQVHGYDVAASSGFKNYVEMIKDASFSCFSNLKQRDEALERMLDHEEELIKTFSLGEQKTPEAKILDAAISYAYSK